MSNKSIARSASVIGIATLLSRILGFVRDILIAALLGTTKAAEAFVVAFRIPNLIRNLAGEGAANSAIVPVLSGYLHKTPPSDPSLKGTGKVYPSGSEVSGGSIPADKTLPLKEQVRSIPVDKTLPLKEQVRSIPVDKTLPSKEQVRSIPVDKEKQEFWKLVYVLFNLFLVILGIVVILGVVFAPGIVRLIAPGFLSDSEKFHLTVKLTRIIFPYLVLVGISALGMGILNTLRSFAAPAFGSCLFNLALIVSALIASYNRSDSVILALGILAGGILQLLIQVPVLARHGFRLRLSKLKFKHAGAAAIGKLLLPRVIGSGVYLLNVFIDTVLATLSWIVGLGGVAAIYYANRLIQFPLGIFGYALSNAALPTMSTYAASGQIDKLKNTLSFSLRSVFLLAFPSAAGLCILSEPIIKVLFQRGEFTAYSTSITASALLFYSLGIPAYAAVKILTSCFYAIRDTKTPVKSAAVALLINIIFNLILIWPLKIGGLALASSIASFANVFILYYLLQKRIGRLDIGELFSSVWRIIIATAFMGIFILFLKGYLANFSQTLALIFTIVASSLAFFLFCLLLGVKEIKGLVLWLLKRA